LSYFVSALEVVSAETVPVRMFTGNQYGNHEVTYTWNRAEQKEFWLLVVRLYLSDHVCIDLPPDMDVQRIDVKMDNANCCTVL